MDRWKEAGKCDCLVRHLGALLHSFPTSRSFLASQIFIGQCRADPLVTTNNRLFLLPTKKCLTYGTRSMKSSPIWRNDDRHSTRHAEKIMNRILQLKKLENWKIAKFEFGFGQFIFRYCKRFKLNWVKEKNRQSTSYIWHILLSFWLLNQQQTPSVNGSLQRTNFESQPPLPSSDRWQKQLLQT